MERSRKLKAPNINRKLILYAVMVLAIICTFLVPGAVSAASYKVTAFTNSGGGTISPPGDTMVTGGDNITYTITPDGGGAVANVWVDGADQGSITTYTFTNVTAKHTIIASFTPYPPYTLQLVGATTMTLTQAQVEAIVAANPVVYNSGTDNWSGVALYRLIALVDDGDAATFNSALASVYSIKMTGADGYATIVAPADSDNFTFASSDSVIVANQKNGSQLPFVTSGKPVYPLKVTGSGVLKSGFAASALVKVELLNLPVTAVGVSPASQSVANGASFTVDLAIDTDTASRGWQANVGFDAAKMQCTGVAEGDFLLDYAVPLGGGTVSGGAATINNTAGTVAIPGYAITGAGTGGPAGTGTLCTLSFTAKAAVNAVASVTLSDVRVKNVVGVNIPGPVVTGGTVAIGNVPMPDLVVLAASAAKASDTTYTITYTIKNQGNDPAVACSTSIVVDGGTPIVVACPALAAGAIDTKTTAAQTFTSPSDSIVVTADSADVVAESSEVNNSREIVYALAGDSGNVIINGNILAKLDLTVPSDILNWVLEQGPNSENGTANVKCNTPWQLQVNDQNETNGHMSKWNGVAYYTDTQLANALNVGCESTAVLSGSNQTIATGDTGGQSDDLGEDMTVTFSQQVFYSDPVLSGGYSYHIVVTFTASSTL